MQEQKDRTKEDNNFNDLLIASNDIHNDDDKTAELSDLRIVPEMKIHGEIVKNNDSIFDESSNLSYRNWIDESNFISKEPPFIDENDIETYRKYDNKYIDSMNIVYSIDEILALDKNEMFLVPRPDSSYYVCSVNFKLIGNFSSKVYNQDVVLTKGETIDDIRDDDIEDLDNIKYKFNNGTLQIREHPTSRFYDIDPDKSSRLREETLFFSAVILFSTPITSIFDPIFFIPSMIVSFIGFIAYVITKYVLDGEWYYIKTEHNSDSLELSYNINEVSNEEDIIDDIQEVQVYLDNNMIHCKDKDIIWKVSTDEYNIFNKEATDFFINMGFDRVEEDFSAYIIPSNLEYNLDCTALESECSNWLLIPNSYI